jgi:diguanylate cyclase (GGDEF)-like protein
MMKRWFLKIGMFWACLLVVALAILISLGITTLVVGMSGGEMTKTSLIAAIVTPGVTAAFFSIVILRLVFDLDEAERRNNDLARTDELTGIRNRRSFLEIAERELGLAKRHSKEFALILFDIDNLKKINDHYGHLSGDKVLREIAHSVKKAIRDTDVFARLGGDEFVILVSESEKLDLEKYMNRLAGQIGEIEIAKKINETITASMGAKRYTRDIDTIDEIYSLADQEMYQSKK